jgi:hypothetical protein
MIKSLICRFKGSCSRLKGSCSRSIGSCNRLDVVLVGRREVAVDVVLTSR